MLSTSTTSLPTEALGFASDLTDRVLRLAASSNASFQSTRVHRAATRKPPFVRAALRWHKDQGMLATETDKDGVRSALFS